MFLGDEKACIFTINSYQSPLLCTGRKVPLLIVLLYWVGDCANFKGQFSLKISKFALRADLALGNQNQNSTTKGMVKN